MSQSRRATRRISRSLKVQIALGAAIGATSYVNWQWRAFDASEANPWVVGETVQLSATSKAGGKTSGQETLGHAPVMAPGELLGGHPATYYNLDVPRESAKLRSPLVWNGRDDPHAPMYDVCVVGGGFAGLHTALYLSEVHKKKVIVLEGRRIGVGASGRNGGDAVVGFHTSTEEIAEIIRDPKGAELLFQQSVNGYNRIKALIDKYKIRCSAEEVGSVTVCFTQPHFGESKMQRLLLQASEECQERLEKFGEKLQVWSKADMEKQGIHTDRFSHGIFNPMNLSLNPLELTLGLARACEENGVKIHEASPVVAVKATSSWKNGEELDQYQLVTTPIGSVKAKHVVIATSHCPSSLSRAAAWATVPLTTGMMVTKELPKKELDEVFTTKTAIFDERYALSYFRRVPGNRILFGCLADPLPMKRATLTKRLVEDLGTTFPSLQPYIDADRVWQGRLDTRWPVFPIISKISGDVKTSSVWFNGGYAGHGLVPSCAGGIALGDYLTTQGKDEKLLHWMRVNQRIPLFPAPGIGRESPALWPVGGPWGTPAMMAALKITGYQDRLLQQK